MKEMDIHKLFLQSSIGKNKIKDEKERELGTC